MGWLKENAGGSMTEIEQLQKRVAGLESDIETLSGILLDFVRKGAQVQQPKPVVRQALPVAAVQRQPVQRPIVQQPPAEQTYSYDDLPPHLRPANAGFSTTAAGGVREDFSGENDVNNLSSVFLESNELKAQAEESAELINKMMRK